MKIEDFPSVFTKEWFRTMERDLFSAKSTKLNGLFTKIKARKA
jgi:hypothetical protein